ncbi:UvrD-helicase domain-containing protein [Deinococcus gobiensis]|uniref:DNA 3'-5' helicase n=1 Tax=Deinococcus gobiensis (strain DSM 21396 / JCM 16679 / CGMCC 1.7299 / I-0) TaxID=745776 RepID=H8H3H2_DEIGI|nr:UvrD-helicase domain-containing protein [Deinococcus gobiensis]AFD28069.1 UvrD/REP helicase [Deinococcus gobiensis I-0]
MSLFENIDNARSRAARTKKSKPLPEPDTYQRVIRDDFRAGLRAMCVDAAPGSGKTTLLQMLAEIILQDELLPEGEKAVFLAFNTKIVKALKKVLPDIFDIRTVNSLGYLICRENIEGLQFEPKKYEDLIRRIVDDLKIPSPAKRRDLLERLTACTELHVGHNLGLNIPQDDWVEVMIGVDAPVLGAEEALYQLTLRVLRQGLKMLQDEKIVSFLDQTLAPSVFGWRLAQPYRYLLVDELQDLDRASLNLLQAATTPESRIVGVGDQRQSLYSFKGADANAIDHFAELFGAERRPLSICYRCPANHVAFAAPYTDNIEPAPQAMDGVLEDIEHNDLLRRAQIGDLILCRENAPLVTVCYDLVRQGTPALIQGRDLSRTLVAFARDAATWDGQKVDRTKASDGLALVEMFEKINAYGESLYTKMLRRAERDGRPADMQLAGLADKISVLSLVLEQGGAQTLGELIDDIRRLFRGKPEESVVLATIHGAKGLEADHIYIVAPELLPHPRAKTVQAQEAERCVMLVAFTRARKSLRIVRPQDGEDPGSLIPEALVRHEEPVTAQAS